jgi:hypothetical protein
LLGRQAHDVRHAVSSLLALEKTDWGRAVGGPLAEGKLDLDAVHRPGLEPANCVLVCVRIPKSGSSSLSHLLRAAFLDRTVYPVPNTLNLDGRTSLFQHLRHVRSRTQNLLRHYHTTQLDRAFEIITERAAPGDLIDGGHIDFATAKIGLKRKLKMITILRDPAERCRSEYNYARLAYHNKPRLKRFDAGIVPKKAARYSFDGFLDFLLERRAHYGDIACRYVGCSKPEEFAPYFSQNVFHAGVLEKRDTFVKRLSDMLEKPLRFPHENHTRSICVPKATPSQRAKIEQIYPMDFALHAWVSSNC